MPSSHYSPEDLSGTSGPDQLTRYIASTAFQTYTEHIGEPITPELAGHLAFKIAELTRTKFSEIIIAEFAELAGKLAGIGEAAEILGVTKQRVHQLAQKVDFPSPIAILRATPVWFHNHIATYGENRKPTGRPKQIS